MLHQVGKVKKNDGRPLQIFTVGHLVNETAHAYVVSASVGENSNVLDQLTIPKNVVVKFQTFTIKGGGKVAAKTKKKIGKKFAKKQQ